MSKKVTGIDEYQVKKSDEKYMSDNDMGYHRFVAIKTHLEQEIQPKICENINDYAVRAINTLQQFMFDATTVNFNGVTLIITKSMKPQDLVDQYHNK